MKVELTKAEVIFLLQGVPPTYGKTEDIKVGNVPLGFFRRGKWVWDIPVVATMEESQIWDLYTTLKQLTKLSNG